MSDNLPRVLSDMASRGRDPGPDLVWERAKAAATSRRTRKRRAAGGAATVIILLAAAVTAVAVASHRARVVRVATTSPTSTPTTPVSSSDEDRILFGRDHAIWSVDPDGGGLRRITPLGCCDLPTWSPGHSRIALVRFGDLTVTQANGTGDVDLGQRTVFAPAWSPDGRGIAFSASPDGGSNGGPLKIVNASGGTARTAADVFAGAPTWSPDGREIAFTDLNEPRTVKVVNVSTGAVRTLVHAPGEQFSPAWSPNGAEIAYASGPDIFATARDGRGMRKIVECSPSPCHVDTPVWSPDGSQIAFVRVLSGAQSLWIVPSSGGHPRRLTSGDDSMPSW